MRRLMRWQVSPCDGMTDVACDGMAGCAVWWDEMMCRVVGLHNTPCDAMTYALCEEMSG